MIFRTDKQICYVDLHSKAFGLGMDFVKIVRILDYGPLKSYLPDVSPIPVIRHSQRMGEQKHSNHPTGHFEKHLFSLLLRMPITGKVGEILMTIISKCP